MKIFGVYVHIDWVSVILAGIVICIVKAGVIKVIPW